VTTIFSKIINRELPAEIIFENERIIVIKDLHPVAPIHLLIISKKEIPCLQKLKSEDLPLLAEMVSIVQELAQQFGIAEGYRLLTNNGESSGQTILHLHFHLIGGRRLGALA
jgi:histidine triad (HIT) family protein